MKNVFVGKLKWGDQLINNYYRIDSKFDEAFAAKHFSGIKAGDYVLPTKGGAVGKLLVFEKFDIKEAYYDAVFSVVKTYSPELSLIGNIANCCFFQPDMNLLNKAIKSTKGVGFIPIATINNCPDIPEIDFVKSKRRFFVCVADVLKKQGFFSPNDICVVVSDTEDRAITDVVEYSGQAFIRNAVLWNLYQEKTNQGEEQYSLRELLVFSAEKNDNAPKKQKYLSALLEELAADGIFTADSPVALYDNVIVGRKQSAPSTPSSSDVQLSIPLDDPPEDLTDYEQYAKLMAFNPNIILHGPPGTGKTYGAMRIIEAFEKQNGQDISFKEVTAQGRARFITFHQAFSYEEFIEGIRPELDENDNMTYPVKPGVLREIADSCRIQEKKRGVTTTALAKTSTSNEVWRISLGQKSEQNIYTALRDKNEIAVGYGVREDLRLWDEQKLSDATIKSPLRMFFEDINIGDIVMVFNDRYTIRLIGVVTSDYFYSSDEDSFGYPHRRKVQWLKSFEQAPKDIFQLNQEKTMSTVAVHRLNISIADAISLLDSSEDAERNSQPYYLIIDEINRGNIAKIFGELITLIEKDKRENLSCTLPYSHKPFTMPKNLYLIGTMNTSDRSIALLDTALRRRFAFVEINPDVSIVERVHPAIGGNVSPAKLLQELNNRITEKIDRDHRIGHSYFLGDDLITKYDLFNVWYYKVLPLLMEYFYNDVKQVSEIVGKGFFDTATGEIIQFSLKPNENGISAFEAALMDIYEGRG
jgi:GTPase subunit of restriction endonuclease